MNGQSVLQREGCAAHAPLRAFKRFRAKSICERFDAASTSDWNWTETRLLDRETGHFEHMFDEAKLEEGRMGENMLPLHAPFPPPIVNFTTHFMSSICANIIIIIINYKAKL